MGKGVRMTENKASIDAVYDMVERVEQKKKRLSLLIIGISISSLLGVSVNAFAFMLFSHQKGALDIITGHILLLAIIFLISITLALLAVKKFFALKRLNQNLGRIGELEETIYNEVLKTRMEKA